MGATNLIVRPTELLAEQIEFAAPPSGKIEVLIYRVDYVDKDFNGQPEQSELPSPDEVIALPVADEDKAVDQSQSDGEDVQKKRYRLEKFKVSTDGSPTAEEIDNLKQQLLDDPSQKTGAYSIIQKEVDGKEVVLDVFSVRDWEETPPQDKPLIQLPKSNEVQQKSSSETGDAAPVELPVPAPTDSSSLFRSTPDGRLMWRSAASRDLLLSA